MGKGKPRDGVGVEDGEAFEGFEIDFGGVDMDAFVRAVGADNELRAGAAGDVGLEDFVWVVKVGEDEIEFGEVVSEVIGELAVAGEKAGEGLGFDGLHAVDEAAGQRELGDVRVAEDFDLGSGELPAQGGDGRERQDEVADCAAADDEDFAWEFVQATEA